MDTILIVDAEGGNEQQVTDKAFRLIYQPLGYTKKADDDGEHQSGVEGGDISGRGVTLAAAGDSRADKPARRSVGKAKDSDG